MDGCVLLWGWLLPAELIVIPVTEEDVAVDP